MTEPAAEIPAQTFAQKVDRMARERLNATGPCTEPTALTAGANKGTWAFDAPTTTGLGEFILQCAATTGAPDPNASRDDWIPHLDGTEEFRVMLSARLAGVPVPEVRHILLPEDELGQGAVTVRIAGETLGVRILRQSEFASARSHMAAQCAHILAAVHRMPAAELPFLERFDADAALALYQRTLDSLDYAVPMLELALQWAQANRPAARPLAVVHGDFRLGNFIAGPEGVRAVLDWEIAHLGDPLEDLGYLCMRTWRFGGPRPVGGFGERADLYRTYEQQAGIEVNAAEVRFWEVLGAMRWAFGCVRRSLALPHQRERKLEFAGVGRRLEEPLYDILQLIEGQED